MQLAWDTNKNRQIKEERGVSFEEIVERIHAGDVFDIVDHPNKIKYPHQKMFMVLLKGYVYCVPCVEMKEGYFLKTIIPSRKATKEYLSERIDDENQA